MANTNRKSEISDLQQKVEDLLQNTSIETNQKFSESDYLKTF